MRYARAIPTLIVAGTLAVGSLLGTSAAVLPTAEAAPASAAVATQAETQAGEKILDYRWEQQSTAYNCGPFAMRIALSVFGHDVAADDLAAQAGTTEAGTNFGAIEPVMNARLGSTFYETKGLAETPTQEQKDLFWHDVQYVKYRVLLRLSGCSVFMLPRARCSRRFRRLLEWCSRASSGGVRC